MLMAKEMTKYRKYIKRWHVVAEGVALHFLFAVALVGCSKKDHDTPQGYTLIEKSSDVAVYAKDDSRIPTEYSKLNVWMTVFRNYATPRDRRNGEREYTYLSTQEKHEYSCVDNEFRTWEVYYFAKPYAKEMTDWYDLKDTRNPMLGWGDISPSSVEYKLRMFACKKWEMR